MIDYNRVIYIDVDDTIQELLSAWCIYLNDKYNLYVDPNDATEWDLTKLFTTLTKDQIYNALYDPQLWKSVHPVPGAQKYLKQLQEDGFDVYLCTATHVQYFKDKYELVINRYFPFITEDHIITIHNKQLLKGLVLVDDYIENLKDATYKGILFESYYNKNIDVSSYKNLYKTSTWKDCYQLIEELYNNTKCKAIFETALNEVSKTTLNM